MKTPSFQVLPTIAPCNCSDLDFSYSALVGLFSLSLIRWKCSLSPQTVLSYHNMLLKHGNLLSLATNGESASLIFLCPIQTSWELLDSNHQRDDHLNKKWELRRGALVFLTRNKAFFIHVILFTRSVRRFLQNSNNVVPLFTMSYFSVTLLCFTTLYKF